YQVNVDLARMKAYGVTLQQVFTALSRGNANAGGNYLEEGEQQYLIRGVGLLRSSADIGSIVVAEHNGTPLLMRDIGEVDDGAVLVTLVLYVFLRNGRAAAIVAAVIPLALLATFIGLRVRGIPANLLSLGAMDFGIIVDGAVIVVENVFRTLARHSHSPDRESARRTILDATEQVGRPTLFSMLIIIVAHIPIFTLQRHEGRIFAPMAYTVSSALVGSLVFS